MRVLKLVLIAIFALTSALQAQGAESKEVSSLANSIALAAHGRRIIVLGELHGTRQAPQLAAALARNLSRNGPLIVGIEISRSETQSLAKFIATPMSSASALRARLAWQKPREQNDGRRSEEMLALIEAVRDMRSIGREVTIVPFDVEETGKGAEARDLAMAELLRARYIPTATLLILTGNVHAMKRKPVTCPQCQTPMTSRLNDLAPFSVNVTARSGTFWGCRTICGPIPVGPQLPRQEKGLYDFIAVFKAFTPARPIEP